MVASDPRSQPANYSSLVGVLLHYNTSIHASWWRRAQHRSMHRLHSRLLLSLFLSLIFIIVHSFYNCFFQKNPKLMALLIVCDKAVYSRKPYCLVLTKNLTCFRKTAESARSSNMEWLRPPNGTENAIDREARFELGTPKILMNNFFFVNFLLFIWL